MCPDPPPTSSRSTTRIPPLPVHDDDAPAASARTSRHRRWLDAAAALDDLLSDDHPPTTIAETVARHARWASGCALAWVVAGAGAGDLRVLAVSQSALAAPELSDLDLRPPAVAAVLGTGTSLRLPDLLGHRRGVGRRTVLRPRIGPTLLVPLMLSTRVEGVLGMAWPTGRANARATGEASTAAAFVESAALGLRLARTVEETTRRVTRHERDRIGADVHDRAIQRLYGLGMELAMARSAPDPSARIDAVLEVATRRIDQTIVDLRRITAGPDFAAPERDLPEVLAEVVEVATSAAAFRPDLQVTVRRDAPVTGALASDLLLVLEEAVSNVVRHAQASRCRISVRVDDSVVLLVEDDGVGLAAQVHGSGLVNVSRRAERHGGSSSLTRLSPGTRLRWQVPLPDEIVPDHAEGRR